MAVIQSGASSDVLTIDPVSKAARVTLYDSAGNEIAKPPTGSYFASVNIRQTAATAANSVVWAMRNGSTRTIYIRRLKLMRAFDGTAAAATTRIYTVQRFSAATPTGGTAITAAKKRTSYPASAVADIRELNTGLTTTGVTFEGVDYCILAIPISVTGTIANDDIVLESGVESYDNLELAANEGLLIRLNTAATIGLGIYGCVTWDER